MERPLILVSNDDGIHAKGVHELIDRLITFGDVVAVCPDSPRSGQSMALTVDGPLRVSRVDDYHGARMYTTNGTPVDCVKLAVHTIVERMPDLMVSGINHGSNASINVNYSGTMGAALEGSTYGIPSVGISLTDHSHNADFTPCHPFVDAITAGVLRHGLPEGTCLNVNIPVWHSPLSEMRLVCAAKGNWKDEYREYTDPAGRKFFWLSGNFVNEEPENEDTDEWCLAHGIVSVVAESIYRTAPDTRGLQWISQNLTQISI